MSKEDLWKARLVLAELQYELDNFDAKVSQNYLIEKIYMLKAIVEGGSNERSDR